MESSSKFEFRHLGFVSVLRKVRHTEAKPWKNNDGHSGGGVVIGAICWREYAAAYSRSILSMVALLGYLFLIR